MTNTAEAVTYRKKSVNNCLTAAVVVRSMRRVNRSKSSAQLFLKKIGVSFSKTGKIRVRPI